MLLESTDRSTTTFDTTKKNFGHMIEVAVRVLLTRLACKKTRLRFPLSRQRAIGQWPLLQLSLYRLLEYISTPHHQHRVSYISGQSAVDRYPSGSQANGAKYRIEPGAQALARRTCPRPSLGANSAWLSAMDGHGRSSLSWGTGSVSACPLPHARVPLRVGPSMQPHAAVQVGLHGEGNGKP